MRCPDCSTVIPHAARFCPKCGEAAPVKAHDPTKPRMAAGAVPSTAPIPRVGKIFILSVLAGIALLVAGAVQNSGTLLIVGLGLLGLVVVVSIIGHHVA